MNLLSNNKETLDQDSAILARRARLIIQGTVAGDFDYYLQPEFGYNNTFQLNHRNLTSRMRRPFRMPGLITNIPLILSSRLVNLKRLLIWKICRIHDIQLLQS